MDRPRHYRLHGIDVCSNVELPDWPEAEAVADPWTVDIAVRVPAWEGRPLPEPGFVSQYWHDSDDGFGVELLGGPPPGRATFDLSWSRRTMSVRHTNDDLVGSADILARWFVPDAARWLHGAVPLHAAAVAIDGRAVLVCGESGRGKSTLAGALIASGGFLMGDEPACVEVRDGRAVLSPGRQQLQVTSATAEALGRLGLPADSLSGTADQKHVISGSAPAESVPVGAIVLLDARRDHGPPLECARLDAVEAMTALLGQRYARPHERDRVRADYAGIARIVNVVPVFRASLIEDMAVIGDVARRLRELMDVTHSLVTVTHSTG